MSGDLTLTRINQVCRALRFAGGRLAWTPPQLCFFGISFADPEMIAAEIGGWNDLSTMHNIYTHLAQKDIEKRFQDFANYF